jgi:hypothetical protein
VIVGEVKTLNHLLAELGCSHLLELLLSKKLEFRYERQRCAVASRQPLRKL